jgi:hypothetical protein
MAKSSKSSAGVGSAKNIKKSMANHSALSADSTSGMGNATHMTDMKARKAKQKLNQKIS